MDPLIASILSKIEFRFINELEANGRFDPAEGRQAPSYFQAADVANTMIHDSSFDLLRRADILSMVRGTTLAGAYLLHRLVQAMPEDRVYLNVGVWHGFSFFAPMIGNPGKTCVGVDHFMEFGQKIGKQEFEELFTRLKRPGAEFYEMDFENFFKGFNRKIGVYYYDAEHSYASHFKAMALASPHLDVGSYVVIDDVDRVDVYRAIFDFLIQSGEFQNYQVVLDLKTASPFHPTWHCGVVVLKKVR